MTISRAIWTLLFVVLLVPAARAQEAAERGKAVAEEQTRRALQQIKARQAAELKAKAIVAESKTKAAAADGAAASDGSAGDPFGKEVKPPAESKKKAPDDKADQQPAPTKPPVDPQLVKFHLQNGSTISGRLTIKHITMETQFGTLKIPIAKIKSITPGLGSNSQLGNQVNGLIEKLGSNVFADRETSEKELLGFGLPVRDALKRRLGGSNEERQRRLKKLLTALAEIAAEQDEEFAPSAATWIERDTVETTKFTVYGSISPKSFQVQSKYGLLTVKLGDILTATRDFGVPQVIRRLISIDQKNLVQRGYKNSGIRVEKGDKITISADGTLAMTPWGRGSRYMSTPAGGSRYGTYKNGILGGTLIAKIGSGSEFKIGTEHRFVAPTSGVLQFAIAMQQGFSDSGNQFPGTYNIRIKVEKAATK
ncbi:MAG: hypothetical protein IID44_01790 [Planctomycetes bacterium]|nr:hypothetical protein [Planctomycetota bacterium]